MSPLIVGSGSSGSEGRSDRFGLPTGTTDPGTSEAGDMYYNTDTSKIRVSDGTAWADLATGGGGGVTGNTIDNSLRFDSNKSSHLSRTFSSAGNRKTFTWAGWAKRSPSPSSNLWASIFTTNNNSFILRFESDTLRYYDYNGSVVVSQFATTALYRDYSAWMHVVFVHDSTVATESERLRLYVNGTRVTVFNSINYPALNADSYANNNVEHRIGADSAFPSRLYDGYMADIHFIDGQALAPTAFGEFDATTGVWNPIEYTGTYPGNSFHLPFSTNDVGNDTSGNNNDWNISENIAVLTGAYSSALTSATLKTVTAGFTKPFNVGRSEGVGGLTFTPPTPIQYTSLVEVYDNNNVTQSRVNSGSFVQHAANAWVTVASGSGTINSMFFQRTDNASFDAGFYAIRVDGRVLYDSNQSDFLKDSPTNGDTANDTGVGGEITGNYATLNPLKSEGLGTFSNGNLDFVQTTAGNETLISTIPLSNGLWYWEVTLNSSTNNTPGIAPITEVSYPGFGSGFGWGTSAGDQYLNGSTLSATTATTGDIIGFAFNSSTFQLRVFKNGVETAFSPVTVTSGLEYFAAFGTTTGNSAAASFNFGQRVFSFAAPAGYKSLNTANLPTPTILNGSDYMDAVLYDGNNSTQTIPLSFEPDFMWLKCRNVGRSHRLVDTVRGVQYQLFSDTSDGGSTYHATSYTSSITSVNSSGFVVANTTGLDQYNTTGESYVSWAWDAGDVAAVTNTDGTTQSVVKANVNAGFSIVQATISASNQTLGHGLGRTPAMVIRKKVDGASNWYTSVKVPGLEGYLLLDGTNTFTNQGVGFSSTVFNAAYTGGTETWINYCFAPIDNYSAFGSWQNNGSGNGTFVHLNFRPRFILLKNTNDVERWYIMDSSRHAYNVPPADATKLSANTANTEGVQLADSATIDFLSNGFKIRTTNTAAGEISFGTRTYFYAAFAENPFSIARAR